MSIQEKAGELRKVVSRALDLCHRRFFAHPSAFDELAFVGPSKDTPKSAPKSEEFSKLSFTYSKRRADASGEKQRKERSPKVQDPEIQALRTVLRKHGFESRALARLTDESVRKLAEFLLHPPPSGHEAARRTVNAVALNTSHTKKAVNAWIDSLVTFPSRFDMLLGMLDFLGSDDFLDLLPHLNISYLPAGGGAGGVTGLSGVEHKEGVYHYFDERRPHLSGGSFSGERFFTRALSHLAPERFSVEAVRKRERARNTLTDDLLQALKLSDIESQTASIVRKRPLLSRNLDVYKELRAAILAYKNSIEAELTEERWHILQHALEQQQSRSGPGGQLRTWFREHLSEHPEAPEGIRRAFSLYEDSFGEKTAEELRFIVAGLVAYQRNHTSISTNVAIGHYLRDLEAYRDLDREDDLAQDPEIEVAQAKILHLTSDRPSLTIAEFLKTVDLSPLTRFREQMNRRRWELYQSEVKEALDYFHFVSFDGDTLRDDAVDSSVPLRRLGLHILGAEIGIDLNTGRSARVVSREEFHAVMQLQKRLLTWRDEKHFLTGYDVFTFRDLLHGTVRGFRKSQYLESVLERSGKKEVVIDRENIGHQLKKWKPQILSGSKFLLDEYFLEESWSSGEKALRLREIIERCIDRSDRVKPEALASKEVQEELSVGLLSMRHLAKIVSVLKELGNYRAVRDPDLVALSEMVAELQEEPLCFVKADYVIGATSVPRGKQYWSTKEVEAARELASDWERVRGRFQNASGQEKDKRLLETLENMTVGRMFHVGGIDRSEQKPTLTLSTTTFLQALPLEDAGAFYFLPPENRDQKIREITTAFVPMSEVSASKIELVKKICSSSGKEQRNRVGLGAISTDTYRTAQQLFSSHVFLISMDFLGIIDQVERGEPFSKRESYLPGQSIGPDHYFVWAENSGRLTPTVNFGRKHNGKPVSVVVQDDLTYFSRFMLGRVGNFPEETKEIVRKIVSLAESAQGYSDEEFVKWMREQE